MGAVIDPFARCGNPLASGNHRGMPDYSDQFAVAARLDPQNAVAIAVVVVCDALNKARENFPARWFRLGFHTDRRIREHHLRTDLFLEPNSERWLSWIVVGKPPLWRSAVVGMGSNPFGVHSVGIHRAIAWPVNERPA